MQLTRAHFMDGYRGYARAVLALSGVEGAYEYAGTSRHDNALADARALVRHWRDMYPAPAALHDSLSEAKAAASRLLAVLAADRRKAEEAQLASRHPLTFSLAHAYYATAIARPSGKAWEVTAYPAAAPTDGPGEYLGTLKGDAPTQEVIDGLLARFLAYCE